MIVSMTAASPPPAEVPTEPAGEVPTRPAAEVPAGSPGGLGTAGERRFRLVSPAAEATRRLGALLAETLQPGEVLLLSGGLGAGKTTLTKGLVAALGSDEEVTSPTFTLCRTYASDPVVAHVDCWRLEQLSEVVDLALEEVLDEGGIVVVEWGEAAAPLLGRDALFVRLGEPGELLGDARSVELSDPSGRFGGRLERLVAAFRGAGPDGSGSWPPESGSGTAGAEGTGPQESGSGAA